MCATGSEEKKTAFLGLLGSADTTRANLIVVHAAVSTTEMDVLFDRNNAAQNSAEGVPLVARHRQSELEMLLSPEFAERVRSGKVRLITYQQLIVRAARVPAT